VNPNSISQTITDIKNTWTQVMSTPNCDLGFFDDGLARMYNSELRISGLIKYFSFVAIFISCIGLFGLSLFVIERKRKEIGIRKVNGARISEVMLLLNRSFIQWVIIAFIIAVPIAWYIMEKWLENFAFRTTISWWVFATSGVIALGIALLTVSYQSYKAAMKNPVESLRYE
ncbi:MAG: FtsX-like permease family protein, partial [Prolixibacteraceae bacterium]|nr:FtsX-like permease family protein [Prolixibacteraceae bacterium]